MPPVEPDPYSGFSAEELQTHAHQAVSGGIESLQDAEAIYRHLLNRDLDRYVKGRIFQRLWAVEQRLGRHGCYFSQAGQDRLVDQLLFKEKRDGVFVEIGGYNGVRGSNCLFFEKFRNWRGVIVEASPDLAARISSPRSAPVIQAAICGHDGTAELMLVTAGLLQMSGLIDNYGEEILKTVRMDPRHEEQMVTVPAMRLETLLTNQGLDRVDYCSIDVEGAERSILADFDFTAFDIGVFSIENGTNSDLNSLHDILNPAGYRLVAILGADEIWSRR